MKPLLLKLIFSTSLLMLSNISLASNDGNEGGIADWVLHSGKIYTVNPEQPWAEAIAIKENKRDNPEGLII